MTLEELELKIRALPGVASDPHTVPALLALVLEYEDAARPAEPDRESARARLAVGLDLPPELYLNARGLL